MSRTEKKKKYILDYALSKMSRNEPVSSNFYLPNDDFSGKQVKKPSFNRSHFFNPSSAKAFTRITHLATNSGQGASLCDYFVSFY